MRHERQPFSETVRFRAPDGFGDAIAKAAARDCSSASAFIRRALVARLRALGVEPCRSEDERSTPSRVTHEVAA